MALLLAAGSGGGSDVTVQLTGQSVATAQGVLGASNSIVTTGQGTATAQGVLGVDAKYVLIGQAGTTTQGTVGLKLDRALSGQSASASQGAIDVNLSVATSGQVAATTPGTITAIIGGSDVTVQLTGQEVAAAQGVLEGSVGVAAIGQFTSALYGIFGVGFNLPVAGHSLATQQGALTTTVTPDASTKSGYWRLFYYQLQEEELKRNEQKQGQETPKGKGEATSQEPAVIPKKSNPRIKRAPAPVVELPKVHPRPLYKPQPEPISIEPWLNVLSSEFRAWSLSSKPIELAMRARKAANDEDEETTTLLLLLAA